MMMSPIHEHVVPSGDDHKVYTIELIVDVFVSSEDILMYIIIVCFCTPIGYVFTSLRDVLIVSKP